MRRYVGAILAGVLTLVLGIVVSCLYRQFVRKAVRPVAPVPVKQPVSPLPLPHLERIVLNDWYRVNGNGYLTFYLPQTIKLRSTERSQEAAWGSVFSDDRIRVFAEYTTFGEEWAESHLEKQNTYQKEFVDIDGRKAKIRSWCWATPETKFKCQAELIISDVPKNWAKLAVDVKHQRDLELARRIFQTVSLP